MMKSFEIWNKLARGCSPGADVDSCFTASNTWSLESLEEPALCLHAVVIVYDDVALAGKFEQPDADADAVRKGASRCDIRFVRITR